MHLVIGLAVALLLAWLSHRLGTLIRQRTGTGLGQYQAIAVAVGVALVFWFILRLTTALPQAIIDAAGIGPAVGLTRGLRRPEEPSRK